MKKFILTLMCAGLTLGLAGCVSSSAENNPSPAPTTAAPSPTVMTTPQPSATTAPMQGADTQETPVIDPNAPGGAIVNDAASGVTGAVDATGNAVMSVTDAGKLSEKIADEVERLSEIDDAEAVVRGDTAVVAVKFDSQYKSGMTTRIQEMVTTRVQNVDKNIKTVHVTNDSNLYTTVGDMPTSLTDGTVKVLDDIGDAFEALVNKIVPVA